MENQVFQIHPQGYDTFSLMYSHYMKIVISPHIDVTEATNWYPDTFPMQRLLGYRGIQVSQAYGIFTILTPEFLSQFSNIVEIGTYNGGLSAFIYDHKSTDCKFITYDIDGSINAVSSILPDIDCRVEDCFEQKTFDDIIELIQSDGRSLVICDGGDKPREFNEFSKYLKSGDHIMCHDYQRDENLWNFACGFWQWPYAVDTSYTSIEQAVCDNNLIEYQRKPFEFIFWGSFIKE